MINNGMTLDALDIRLAEYSRKYPIIWEVSCHAIGNAGKFPSQPSYGATMRVALPPYDKAYSNQPSLFVCAERSDTASGALAIAAETAIKYIKSAKLLAKLEGIKHIIPTKEFIITLTHSPIEKFAWSAVIDVTITPSCYGSKMSQIIGEANDDGAALDAMIGQLSAAQAA